jgi:hypothetical protein
MYWIYVGKVYKSGAEIICEEKREAVRSGKLGYRLEKINVLFMGHSKILSGIIPEYFDSLMDHKVYSLNLSLPALPIGPHYFELLDYLKCNPNPEYIVLHLTKSSKKPHPIFAMLFGSLAVQGIKFPEELISYWINREDKQVVYNFFYPRRIYRRYIGICTYNLIFDYTQIHNKKESNIKIIDQMIKDRGYYFIKEQALFSDHKLPKNFKSTLTENPGNVITFKRQLQEKIDYLNDDPYVKKFFDLVLLNNIKVLLIVQYYREGTFVQLQEMPKLYQAVLDHYQNVFIAEDGWKLKFYSNAFFSDPAHTNYEGAKLYTEDIAEEFKEVFHPG